MRTVDTQHGAALVEFALSISVLLVVVAGITEFGRAMYQYNTLVKTARDAVRFLSVRDPSSGGAIDEAKCIAVYGNPTCSGSALATGLTTSMIEICHAADPTCAPTHRTQGASPVVNLVSVTIGTADNPYEFQSAMPFLVPSFRFAPITATMRQVL
jgi:Flp pilus assembly protein TadG